MAKKIIEFTSKTYDNLHILVDGRDIELQNPLNFSMDEEIQANLHTNNVLHVNAIFSNIVIDAHDQKFLKSIKDAAVIVKIMNAWKIWGDSEKEAAGVATPNEVNLDVK